MNSARAIASQFKQIMKKVLLSIVGTLLIVASGCQSSLTVCSKANESEVLGVSAGTKGASVTLPLVKATLGTSTETGETAKEKKK